MACEQNVECLPVAPLGTLEELIRRICRNVSVCRECLVARLSGVVGHSRNA
jgi:hypothetical protein